jgi:hypothetical protein
MFDILETDIVIMQETKIQRKDLHDDMVLVPGWDVYFSLPKHKKGMLLPKIIAEAQLMSSQDTQVLLSTLATRLVVPFAPRKESSESSALQTPPPSSETSP